MRMYNKKKRGGGGDTVLLLGLEADLFDYIH